MEDPEAASATIDATCKTLLDPRSTDSGKVSLVNLSDKPIDVPLDVKTGAGTWDDHSMYFNAA